MTLSINAVPPTWMIPGTYAGFDASQAQTGLPARTFRVLIIGQALPNCAGPLNTPVKVVAPGDGAQWGRGSMIDRMVRSLKDVNNVTETWAIAMADNGAGVAATRAITINQAADQPGTLPLYIGGQRLQIGLTGAQTAAQIATAAAAAVNAALDLPVTAGAAGAVLTLTNRWKGATGLDVDVRAGYYSDEALPHGLQLTIAASAAGATNPDLTATIAAIGQQRYDLIVLPFTDTANVRAIETELESRWGPLHNNEGVAIAAAKGSVGTLGALGSNLNAKYVAVCEATGPTTTWERAARLAGVLAYAASVDPARPFQTLQLGDLAPTAAERLADTDRNLLLLDGISTTKVDASGNTVIERPISTYTTDGNGDPDPTWRDLNTHLLLAYLRFSLRSRINTKFPRSKLADDGIQAAPGANVVTPSIMAAEIVALARQWEAAGLVEDIPGFKRSLTVVRNTTDRSRLDVALYPTLVGGLRVTVADIRFLF